MPSTALELIKDAQRILGTPARVNTQDALRALNMMLDNWAVNGVVATAQTRSSASIAAGSASYTIGSGQTINATKPQRIISAFLRDSDNTDTALSMVEREQYDSISTKSTTGVPDRLFYDPGVTQQATQVGTIYLYPVPSSAYTLFMEAELPFTQIATFTAGMTFPSYYERAIKFGLAIELAPESQVEPSDTVIALATAALKTLKDNNFRNAIMDSRPVRRGGATNILTDD
jgi:hypothetical protein